MKIDHNDTSGQWWGEVGFREQWEEWREWQQLENPDVLWYPRSFGQENIGPLCRIQLVAVIQSVKGSKNTLTSGRSSSGDKVRQTRFVSRQQRATRSAFHRI